MAAATVDHRCVKTEDHAVAAGHCLDPAQWQAAFECLMGRIAGRFKRVEPRRRVRRLVLGLLSDLPRKNCSHHRRVGRGDHPGRHAASWSRWITLAMLAHAFLAVVRADEHARPPAPDGLAPLTCNEIQRLFITLAVQPIHTAAYRLRWSTWRRRYQARSQTSHYQRQAAQNRFGGSGEAFPYPAYRSILLMPAYTPGHAWVHPRYTEVCAGMGGSARRHERGAVVAAAPPYLDALVGDRTRGCFTGFSPELLSGTPK
jgi:hypothetical protein